MQNMLKQFTSFVADKFPLIIYALVILLVGLMLVKIIMRIVTAALNKSGINPSVRLFLKSLVKVMLYFVLIIIVAGNLGINTNSLIAVLGAAGLAVSLALKDSLSNLASGILLLVSHPFNVGEFVEISGSGGTVSEIGLIYTRLNTLDNSRLYIPNSRVLASDIRNFSAEDKRRLDIVFKVSRDADIDAAKKAVYDVLENSPGAHKEPAPVISINSVADDSVEIVLKVWVDNANYWELNYYLHEFVKKRFDERGIEIPYKTIQIKH